MEMAVTFRLQTNHDNLRSPDQLERAVHKGEPHETTEMPERVRLSAARALPQCCQMGRVCRRSASDRSFRINRAADRSRGSRRAQYAACTGTRWNPRRLRR